MALPAAKEGYTWVKAGESTNPVNKWATQWLYQAPEDQVGTFTPEEMYEFWPNYGGGTSRKMNAKTADSIYKSQMGSDAYHPAGTGLFDGIKTGQAAYVQANPPAPAAAAPANSTPAATTAPETGSTVGDLAGAGSTQDGLTGEPPPWKVLHNWLLDREQWLNDRQGEYSGEVDAASQKYGGVIDSLTNRMNDPNEKISVGMQGFDPISFTPQTTRNDVSTLESLAANDRSNSLAGPSLDWAWQQQNPVNTGNMQYFDYMQQLANQTQNRAYGLPSTVDTSLIAGSKPDLMTQLAGLSSIFDKAKVQ